MFWPPQIRKLTLLRLFEKDTILTPLSKNLALQKHMSITGLMRRLSLIGIDAIWQLSLGCLFMRTIASFLPYTGSLNFINSPINRVLMLILVHVQLTSCLFFLLTFCLTAIKNHVIKYCTTVYGRNGKNLFWSIKNSGEILNKLKSRDFLASGLSTYDFSTLYTTLPHNIIKEKLTELIEQILNREGSLFWLVMIKMPFLLLNNLNDINCGLVRKCVMRSIIF